MWTSCLPVPPRPVCCWCFYAVFHGSLHESTLEVHVGVIDCERVAGCAIGVVAQHMSQDKKTHDVHVRVCVSCWLCS
jgi:hypothetical protein